MKIKVYKFDEIENIKEFSNQRLSLFYSILVYFLLLILVFFSFGVILGK